MEHDLLSKATDAGEPVEPYRLFWMNRNYAAALSRAGHQRAAIDHLDEALKVRELTPEAAANYGGLAASYQLLIDWLKAESRAVEAEAVRKRAVASGVLKP